MGMDMESKSKLSGIDLKINCKMIKKKKLIWNMIIDLGVNIGF